MTGEAKPTSLRPALLGAIAGFIVTAAVAGGVAAGVGVVLVKKARPTSRSRSDLTEAVVVAARDIPAGATVEVDAIDQRSIPTELLTQDMVRASSASSYRGLKIFVPLSAGQPLRQPWFELAQISSRARVPVSPLVSACRSAWPGASNSPPPPQTVDEIRAQLAGGAP